MNLNSIYNLGRSKSGSDDSETIVLSEIEASKPPKKKAESVTLPFLAKYGYACAVGAIAAIVVFVVLPAFMSLAYSSTMTHMEAFKEALHLSAQRYEAIGNGDFADKFAIGIPLVGAALGSLLRKLQLAD